MVWVNAKTIRALRAARLTAAGIAVLATCLVLVFGGLSHPAVTGRYQGVSYVVWGASLVYLVATAVAAVRGVRNIAGDSHIAWRFVELTVHLAVLAAAGASLLKGPTSLALLLGAEDLLVVLAVVALLCTVITTASILLDTPSDMSAHAPSDRPIQGIPARATLVISSFILVGTLAYLEQQPLPYAVHSDRPARMADRAGHLPPARTP